MLDPREEIAVRRASTRTLEPERAVAELAAALDAPDLRAVVLFVAPGYDLDGLGRSIARRFQAPVVGCTTAGNLGPHGFEPHGIQAVGLAGGDLAVRVHLLDDIRHRSLVDAGERASGEGLLAALESLAAVADRDFAASRRGFCVVLSDGLCQREEWLVASLYQHLGGMPIVGGSAGDALAFERTAVYFDGRFRSDAMVLASFATRRPTRAFKIQHFVPSERRVVVTGATADARVVHELDGLPAVEAYARAIGVSARDLTPALCSQHPLLLRMRDESFVRSVRSIAPDGTIHFFCAIEEGLVLSVGQAVEPLRAVSSCFAEIRERIGTPHLVLGFDCVLRRLEFERTGLVGPMGDAYASHGVVGFSTYGEQYHGIHVNQTLTGVALA